MAASRGLDNIRVLSLSTHMIKSQEISRSCLDHIFFPGLLIVIRGERYLSWQGMVRAEDIHSFI